jgi:hypothetical protein
VAVALVFCLGVPKAALADDTGVDKVVGYALAGLAAGVFDIAFTIHDVSHLVSGERSSRTLGVVEVLGATPQVAVATYLFVNPPPADGVRPLTLIWAAWAAALAVHGVWTIANPAERQTTATTALAVSPQHSSTERIDASASSIGTRLDAQMWSANWRF